MQDRLVALEPVTQIHGIPGFVPAGREAVNPRRFHQLQAFSAVPQSGRGSR
jgi:hypothetical protein